MNRHLKIFLPIIFLSTFNCYALEPLKKAASAESSDAVEITPAPLFADLILTAGMVAVAQLNDTRYEYLRGFPNKGTAWMRPLMRYKSERKLEQFTVYDEGIKGEHCYFPDTDLWQEGSRFLVFLEHEEFIRYRGLNPVCYLPVSVSSDNQYVLRLPIDNVVMPAELLEQAQHYQFTDSGSRIDTSELLREEKARLIRDRQMKDEGETLVYTRGIPISAVRKYINTIIAEANANAAKTELD